MSARALAVATVGLYAAGLAVPLGLHLRVVYLVESTLLGTALAAGLALAWFEIRIQAANRRLLVEWTTDLRLLNAAEFEWLVGEVFRREGWTIRETGRQDAPDGNIDLELTREGSRMIAQCKKWNSRYVGVREIREFAGTLLREGLAGDAGVFVALSEFTSQARSEATQMGIHLIDNRELYARLEQVRQSERCPQCEAPMLLDHSTGGWWLRCVSGACPGKRDLGPDPGRAVELLTQLP
ncbi:MAG TPA: restriction endonuclease [Acidimicrobiales bacterium]|nr:restriction endonuclease [Acidimicrobiales bacterium]